MSGYGSVDRTFEKHAMADVFPVVAYLSPFGEKRQPEIRLRSQAYI